MKKIYGLFTLFLGLPPYSTIAEDVRVQITGAILAQSCNVKSSDLIKNVIFDDIDPQVLTPIGATTVSKKVSVALENCTGNVSSMSYMFSGTSDASNPDLLKVTGKPDVSSEGIASGLAIEILDMNQKSIPLNQKQAFSQKITTPNYDFNFYLRYKSTGQTIEAGDASSLLYLDFYYE
ncbi:fimbrial protein [Hafnia alvei]|uniref:fimbrial protein n=1 Tax=Hafnia alvei TaxID=569 RepID=UPI0024A94A4A|nr:fimbrial protein [Hafnia alvei]